jgi:hypothetical protein
MIAARLDRVHNNACSLSVLLVHCPFCLLIVGSFSTLSFSTASLAYMVTIVYFMHTLFSCPAHLPLVRHLLLDTIVHFFVRHFLTFAYVLAGNFDRLT